MAQQAWGYLQIFCHNQYQLVFAAGVARKGMVPYMLMMAVCVVAGNREGAPEMIS
jgi:hypothetical protein